MHPQVEVRPDGVAHVLRLEVDDDVVHLRCGGDTGRCRGDIGEIWQADHDVVHLRLGLGLGLG